MPIASADSLTGFGFSPQQAALIGANPITQAGVGTAQVGATVLRSKSVEATTAGGATAFIINSGIGVNEPIFLVNSSATAALVFPPVGGTMNGSLNASFSVAQFKPAIFWQYKKGFWTCNLSA